ncbi:hypothetical protein CES85_2414 [Ochrobactrum quorumnocens]|uniref:Uncharacterized protein n=1 Tax=Ochrobactrum quorumnocens TaxID=271865 RepID=A0A248ULN3_9HYPH|nr:hypothetical protein CES85_2414 [[Ochrobactrum] quorumnocens]
MLFLFWWLNKSRNLRDDIDGIFFVAARLSGQQRKKIPERLW